MHTVTIITRAAWIEIPSFLFLRSVANPNQLLNTHAPHYDATFI